MHVFFYEAFEEEEEALRSFLPDHIEAGFTWKTIQEYGADSPPAPIISLRTQSEIPNQWAGDLDAILSRSTGYDHLLAYRRDTGVHVPSGHLPLYCHRAVAEQALLLWLALQRKLPQQMGNFSSFHRDGLTGHESEHKNLLVVGVGNIGGQVARIGHGLGMNVSCVDLVEKYPAENYVKLEEGLKDADIVVCSMNLTEENRGYFSYDVLKQTKPGTLFVNVSRGELSPSEGLMQLLEEGHLAGVGLDVYNEEKALAGVLRGKAESDHPEVLAAQKLASHPHAILTPHNAFNTEEGVQRKSSQSVEQIESFLQKGNFIWPVN
ncbi:MAG: NAD(P)-dependent oxidoreductase [Bacteroidota bacterium]